MPENEGYFQVCRNISEKISEQVYKKILFIKKRAAVTGKGRVYYGGSLKYEQGEIIYFE